MTPILEMKSVAKGFGPRDARTEVLHDVNLSVQPGEFVAIVGFSGSGKSTLMSLLAGMTKPDAGEILYKGTPVTGPAPERAIVFQNYSLLPWLSVFGNISLAVDQVFASWPADKRREHVENYIALVNLTPARDRKPRELSGGMRQRVAVARALAVNPDVLLLDEPLGALDALTRGTLQDEIGRMCQQENKTVVLITNDVDEAILLADRIIPLIPGACATLGEAFAVNIPRPRDKKELNHNLDYRRIRNGVTDYLLNARRDRGGQVASEMNLPLPALTPVLLT